MFDFLKKRNPQLDNDVDGKPLFKDDIIADISEKLRKSKDAKLGYELQWQLNSRFLEGDQYCDINTGLKKIYEITYPHDNIERETYNMILPLIETRIANLKRINYIMRVKPCTTEADDYYKAETSTSILQYLQRTTDFERKKNTAIYWNEICGNCFFLSWWDSEKGEEYARETVIDIDAEEEQVKQTERIWRQGDLDYGLISPYEVYPESITKQGIEAQRYIIIEQVKTAEDIYDMFGIEVEGKTVDTFSITPIASGGGTGYVNSVLSFTTSTVENAVKLITYFEKPSRAYPRGRLIMVIDEDEIVYYGDLPYEHIPLVQMVCREVPGRFFGRSVIEDLIPRQRAYNGCINRIHEYIKRAAIGSYFIQEGSVDMERFCEEGLAAGEALEYKNGFEKPTPVPVGALPSELLQERYNLKSDMEYVAGTSQLMVNGATPSGVTSGTAIQSLMEIDSTRLSMTGDNIRNAVKKLAIVWLEIYKKFANTRRIINICGTNEIGASVMWCSEDITSFDVEYTTENELVTSEATQQQNFERMYQLGAFTDSSGQIPDAVKSRMIKDAKVGNYTDLMSIDELDRQAARNEIALFKLRGVIPDVSEFDNHDIHADEHKRFTKQMEFTMLKLQKPQLAAAFEEHIRQHTEAKRAEGMKELQSVMRVSAAAQNGGGKFE